MMKASRSEKFLKIFFPIFGACIIIVSLFTIASWMGLLDFLHPSVSMEEWPAYDESYRLDTGGREPTKEEIAYYVATKIPDEGKKYIRRIYIRDKYYAVSLGLGPDYDESQPWGTKGPYYPPYEDTVALSDGWALDVMVVFKKNPENYTVFDIASTMKDNTDCYFSHISFWLPDGPNPGVSSSSYIPIKKYQKYFPDYVIQPET